MIFRQRSEVGVRQEKERDFLTERMPSGPCSQVISSIYCAIMLLLVDIAEEIAKQRKAAGLSRAELAKRALVEPFHPRSSGEWPNRRARLCEGQQDSDRAGAGAQGAGGKSLPTYPR